MLHLLLLMYMHINFGIYCWNDRQTAELEFLIPRFYPFLGHLWDPDASSSNTLVAILAISGLVFARYFLDLCFFFVFPFLDTFPNQEWTFL